MRSYRSVSAAVFAIVFCALVGGFFGRSALATQDQLPDQYKVFTAALKAVEANYVGEVVLELPNGRFSGSFDVVPRPGDD